MFYQGKKVLVTGGTGFVGSHIVDQLLAQGAHVRIPRYQRVPRFQHERLEVVPGDLNSPADCRQLCRGMNYVFHAGGTASSAGTTPSAAMNAITLNTIVTLQTLQAAWDEGVERTLVFSSSTGYPAADHALTEDEMWSGPPYPGYFGYAWTRRYFERMAEFVASKSSMKVAVLRPTAVYGPRDASGHVIPSLIRRAVAKQNPFVVWGDGSEVRDFLHISDLARGALLLLEKHLSSDPVNIGYGSAVTVKQCLAAILKAAGHEQCELIFDTTKPTTIPFRMVDISKANKLLSFAPQVKLEDGLADTVKWFQANPQFAVAAGH
ncbi:MAG: hypothetical protein RL380_1067 [Verrucomicrobiota bacterium]